MNLQYRESIAKMRQDIEFASIMVQNLNNNLITAPELSDMRKRLRNLESKVIIPIVRSAVNDLTSSRSCSLPFSGLGATTPSQHSPCVCLPSAMSRPTTFSKYCKTWADSCRFDYILTPEHSAELEMTVNMLIQIDKLVQLLESPVFTCTTIPP